MGKVGGFHKYYNLRRPVPDQRSMEVMFPFEVIELAAQRRDMTVDEFLKKYQTDVEFDTSETVTYTIVERESNGKKES